ncbi:uncharacterized protein H6S33_012661 [Morchella sextelata]|uniref:uncharacterized protein n=1 Tax=Morchella sextelata TaxID=1174677 RepID=UPI001D04CD15|nr:uncharacterized protein H6S33_012661 [Morchella sextelata]KAH0610115.1 hypothetical protein H6S33_012661 [Morchella sextelata]
MSYAPPDPDPPRRAYCTKLPNTHTLFIKIPVAVALIGNPLLAWQHHSYVTATIQPLSSPALSTNQSRITLREDFAILVTLALLLSVFNGILASHLLRVTLVGLGHLREYIDLRSPLRPALTKCLWRSFTTLSVLAATAAALLLTFAQFVSPFVTPGVAWERRYAAACDGGMDVRVFLDAADSRPARSVLFGDLQSLGSYRMVMEEEEEEEGDGVRRSNFSVVSARDGHGGFVPRFGSVLYDVKGQHLQAFDEGGQMVMESAFGMGDDFGIEEMGLEGDAGPFSRRCVFDPTVEVREKGKEGVVMRTVQFTICGQLQLCAQRDEWDKVQVVAGLLILMRKARPSRCCKGSVIPGVAGRDAGWDGKGVL